MNDRQWLLSFFKEGDIFVLRLGTFGFIVHKTD